MKPFTRSLQWLLSDASSSEHDTIDTLCQVLSVALKLPGTIVNSIMIFELHHSLSKN